MAAQSTTFHLSRNARSRSERGLSLIELLIAIALGALLLLGLVQIFSGVRVTLGTSESLSRVQESGRFALEFLRRDLRMAGHFGCLNEFGHFPVRVAATAQIEFVNYYIGPTDDWDSAPYPLRAHVPVEVYDYSAEDTGPGDSFTIDSDNPAPAGDRDDWTPSLPVELGIEGDALPGSDIVVVRYFDQDATQVRGVGMFSPNGSTGIDMGAAAVAIQDDTPYGFTNCLGASLFHAQTSVGSNVIRVDEAPNVPRGDLTEEECAEDPDAEDCKAWWAQDGDYSAVGEGALLHRFRMVVYFVGQGLNGPALMRRTLDEAGGVNLSAAEEVVDGVEMMQIMIGVDSSAPRDDVIDVYTTPAEHLDSINIGTAAAENALKQLTSLRVSLLMRGSDSRPGSETPPTVWLGDLLVTPPADGRIRQAYETIIALRNRLRA